jgi:putative hemolysin
MEVVVLLLLIVVNGVFAMSEIAVVSARKARLQQWAAEGSAQARSALELANSPNRFLSTVQVGITLIGVLAGAFGEATLAADLAAGLRRLPGLAAYSDVLALAVVVLGITYLSLVIGELVPKRLALQNPERIAAAVAVPMRTLSVIAFPLVRVLSVSTDAVLRLLGARPSQDPPVTEEELKLLIRQGTRAGVFEEAEQDMLTGVLQLGDRRVGALMTPRMEIVWLDVEDPPDAIREKIVRSGYSRYPVCQGSLDEVLGVVQVKDILVRYLAGEPIDLRSILVWPPFVPESAPAAAPLELFKESGLHMALVINEYGSLEGLVTLQDLLEEIVGEVEMEEPQIVRRQDGSWSLDGMLPIDEFKELFEIRELPGEPKGQYQTLGGFVMAYLGRIPDTGDVFHWGGMDFEVVDMDGRRVDRVVVRPAEQPAGPDEGAGRGA